MTTCESACEEKSSPKLSVARCPGSWWFVRRNLSLRRVQPIPIPSYLSIDPQGLDESERYAPAAGFLKLALRLLLERSSLSAPTIDPNSLCRAEVRDIQGVWFGFHSD